MKINLNMCKKKGKETILQSGWNMLISCLILADVVAVGSPDQNCPLAILAAHVWCRQQGHTAPVLPSQTLKRINDYLLFYIIFIYLFIIIYQLYIYIDFFIYNYLFLYKYLFIFSTGTGIMNDTDFHKCIWPWE